MKKIIPAAITAVCVVIFSCNSHTGPSALTAKNLAAAHGIQRCFDTKDFSKLGDYVAADAVDHGGENGDIRGLANMKAEFEKMSATIDSAKTTIVKELADEEYVMSWLRFTGTVKAAQMGLKAGDKYNMKAIELSKYKDGKVVEHWTFMEPAEMMQMMSTMQAAAPAEPKKTE